MVEVNWFNLGVVFVFGLIYGSFLNVVVYRYDDWISIARTRSHCRECKTNLGPLDLIPVLSYIMLRGKCRYCQKPISIQYPIVELVTALLFVAGYNLIFTEMGLQLTQGAFAFAFYILVIGAMIAVFCHDLMEMMIPDSLSNILLICAAIFMIILGKPREAFIGALVGLIPIALIVYPSKGKWMGEGDVKLAASLGILSGFPGSIIFLGSSFVIGGLFGGLLMIFGKAKAKTAVPFGPFLIFGALIAIFYGQAIIDWYTSFMML